MACQKHIPFENAELLEALEISGNFIRLKSTKNIDPNEPLGKKSSRPDILAKLAQIEQEVIAKAKARGII